MPKPTAAPGWTLIENGGEQVFAFAPAEIAVQWQPTAPTGKIELCFTYWGTLVGELPPHLRPSGDPHTPSRTYDSAAAATAAQHELAAFVKARYPAMKPKRKASLHLTRLLDGGDANFWLTAHPQNIGDLALAAPVERGWTWQAGKDRVLLWQTEHLGGLRVRASADEVVFVDAHHEVADDALAALVTGASTDHGTWKFANTLVACDAAQPTTALKGVTGKTVAALRAVLGDRPLRALPAKGEAPAGALLAKLAGTFRATIGGKPGQARWLRLARV
jgi:hypothetical protein